MTASEIGGWVCLGCFLLPCVALSVRIAWRILTGKDD